MAHVRLQADAGKEIEQQGVANLQIEFDLDIQAKVKQGRNRRTDEAADDRFGDTVLTEKGVVLDEGFAEEKQEDGKGKTHEAVNLEEL
ncbi:hypothetical protein D3C71_1226040 [compost metagenome]